MTGQLVTINAVDTVDIRPKVNQYRELAETLAIINDQDYQDATGWVKEAKHLQKYIEDRFKPTKDSLNAAKNELMKMIKGFLVPLQEAEQIIKDKMTVYYRKKEHERLAEQRRLQEEARKAEEERRLNEAIDTGDEGVLDEPVIAPEVQLENTQKVAGVSYVEQVQFDIYDENSIPREYLMPDEQKIRRVARATKGKIEIPGVKIWVEKRPSIRA